MNILKIYTKRSNNILTTNYHKNNKADKNNVKVFDDGGYVKTKKIPKENRLFGPNHNDNILWVPDAIEIAYRSMKQNINITEERESIENKVFSLLENKGLFLKTFNNLDYANVVWETCYQNTNFPYDLYLLTRENWTPLIRENLAKHFFQIEYIQEGDSSFFHVAKYNEFLAMNNAFIMESSYYTSFLEII